MIRIPGRMLLAAALLCAAAAAPVQAQKAAPAADAMQYSVPEFGTMWTFDAPPIDYWKSRYGFEATQEWLDHVRLSAVRLPGCSASFVSGDGMVMTNHHCARQCISAVSPADSNYQRTGFVADRRESEKRCPGLYVDQLESIADVTPRIRAKVTGATADARVAQREAEIQAIQEECQASTGRICQVVAFYQGGMYSLYRYRRYDDVRLVMAPEEEISFFGGDPDNFTFPRFDLDLTLLRVYQDDEPFQPKDYLRWSEAGAGEGELVFVVGNPGSTGRLLTLAQMEYLRDVQYPAQLAQIARSIAIYKELAAQGEESRRQYENTIFSLENSQKAIGGYLSGLLDEGIMARKAAFEKDFRSRIEADPKLRAEYGGTWDAIAAAQREIAQIATQARYYGLGGSSLLSAALGVVRLPQQAALPAEQRLAGYAGEGLERAKAQLLRPARVDFTVERKMLAAWLAEAEKELGASDALVKTLLAGRTPEAAAAALVAGTRLGDDAVRKALVEGGAQAVAKSKDPLVVAVRQHEAASLELAERLARLSAEISANAEKLGAAIYAAYGKALPPDATFTLRISDGVVKGYPMNGTRAPYKTSVGGLYARSYEFDGQPPFRLPERWQERAGAIDPRTPMNFVSTNDIIGGNSGSPVINAEGEVVGLIFDGNIEMLPNRFIFTDEVSRAVSVHSCAIVEALRKVYDAGHIADELEGKSGAK